MKIANMEFHTTIKNKLFTYEKTATNYGVAFGNRVAFCTAHD
jgi:hypothetical protein